jgi:FAD/FMN-containing dehydrogenase
MVIDNVVQLTIVTSSGDILTASSSSNPDLYWALRGGGGNFGVVTEFVLKLYDQRPDLYCSSEFVLTALHLGEANIARSVGIPAAYN